MKNVPGIKTRHGQQAFCANDIDLRWWLLKLPSNEAKGEVVFIKEF